MENKKSSAFKLSVWGMCAIGLFLVVWEVIDQRFGIFPSYKGHRNNELMGIYVSLLALVFPLFKKNTKEELWNKKSIVMFVSTLIISTVLIAIMYANKEYYRIDWIESAHWDRDHCPPIIWDIWNIIGN